MENISPRKARTFLVKLNQAQTALESRENSAAELKKQFEKVKQVSLEKIPDKSTVEGELNRLSQKINELLEKERILLAVQNSSIRKSDIAKDRINEVYSLVNNLKEIDSKEIPILVESIKNLDKKLDEAVRRDQTLSAELKNKINDVEEKLFELHQKKSEVAKYEEFGEAMKEIKEKVNSIIEAKLKSETRVRELEEKMKRGEIETKSEFDMIGQQVKNLENKLFDLRARGQNPEQLKMLHERISKLKQRVQKPAVIENEESSDEDFGIPEPFS